MALPDNTVINLQLLTRASGVLQKLQALAVNEAECTVDRIGYVIVCMVGGNCMEVHVDII